MKSETIAGLSLFYEPEEVEAVRLVRIACERSVRLLHQRWGMVVPEDCRVFVMSSWLRFLFHSAPWPWKIYLALTLPLIARRASAIWPYSGGWALQYGRRRVVGVKPPGVIQMGDQSLGKQIFIQNRDLSEKVQSVTCHELVHAFTFHLKLPAWLHEGLATLAMEYFLDRRIVRAETLENVGNLSSVYSNRSREKLRIEDQQALISQYARGYWLTRYLDETQPELLKDLLSRRMGHKELDEKVASAFGKDPKCIWKNIGEELGSHFL